MMLVMVSMMIMSSCVSSSLSSGLFVGANEDWFTGQLFDWMDTPWWNDFKSWFGFSTASPPADTPPPPGTPPGGSTPPGGNEPSKKDYKENCVYLYGGKDAKSGYLNSVCVDEKNAQKFWKWNWDRQLNSIRVGKEVKVNVLPDTYTESSLKLNGKDVSKPINLSDHDWDGRAYGISAAYKSYSSSGKLQRVGDARDEKSVYLYADEGGNAYIATIRSKSSGSVTFTHSHIKYVSSIRAGKNTKVYLFKGSTSTKFIKGEGTNKVINVKQFGYNDQIKQIRVDRQ
jgi:hypothetical protein